MTSQHILVVDDEPEIRNTVSEILKDEGFTVSLAENAAAAREQSKRQTPDLVFLDIWMPDEDGVSLLKDWKEKDNTQFPVVMMSGHGTVETAVEATRIGAFDYIEKPLSLAKLLRVTTSALEYSRKNTARPVSRHEIIKPVGSSAQLQQLRQQCEKAAQHDTWLMITGEAGTGKSMAASYIHSLSARNQQAFIEIIPGSVPEEEMAAKLLGVDRNGEHIPGLVEEADGGTLYINEVADLDSTVQSMLLGILNQQEITPIGSAQKIPINIRVMASSQHNLNQRVSEGSFNEELFYHLNVLPLRVVSLREHAEDIPELLSFYVDYFYTQDNLSFRHFTLAAQNYLRYYSWPGNVLQLRNLVQRLQVQSDDEEISQDEVEEALVTDRVEQSLDKASLLDSVIDLPLREARDAFEREYLIRHLEKCHGNVSRLAERVGMERTHLYRKMRALGVKPNRK